MISEKFGIGLSDPNVQSSMVIESFELLKSLNEMFEPYILIKWEMNIYIYIYINSSSSLNKETIILHQTL